MPYRPGSYVDVETVSGKVDTRGGKRVIVIKCVNDEDEPIDVLLWMTPKAMPIARRNLELCGWDIEKRSLRELEDDPGLIGGARVTIQVKEYKGKPQGQITVRKEALGEGYDDLDAMLRGESRVKKKEADHDDDDVPF